MKRNPLLRLVLLLVLLWPAFTFAASEGIQSFTSDGCSLFPDGTPNQRDQWCDCCQEHDIAYWQGGTEEQRLSADAALRDCVLQRTGNETLAETMYLGVRGGGHPAFPTWYRWGYGWPYGRGYRALDGDEKEQVAAQLARYQKRHPQGYCVDKGEGERPPSWATPEAAAELKNFYRLDAKVYRAAQPNAAGFGELKGLGIVNILSLREYHDDKDLVPAGFNLHRIKMAAGSPTTAEIVEALRFIRSSQGPVLIHCWHGSDRTGLISAMYRVALQGWTKEAAIDELANGGYGYHAFFYPNIPEFIRNADVEALRKAVMAP